MKWMGAGVERVEYFRDFCRDTLLTHKRCGNGVEK